jgi:hypothetical protein
MSGFALISNITMFLVEFQTFHTQYVDMCMISLHIIFCLPCFSVLLVIVVKLKAKGNVLRGHDLVILHSTTVAYFPRSVAKRHVNSSALQVHMFNILFTDCMK